MLAERADDMAFFEERVEKGVIAKLQGIVDSEFVRMDYAEAIRVLERAKQKFEFPVRWGVDLQSEHERYVSEKHAGKPVVLMNYPKEIKAFYMRLNDDERTVAAMDVLAPGIGEIIGGSQREERAARPRCPAWPKRGSTRALRLVSRPAPLRHACRTRASASASSAPLRTSPALPTCATSFRSREHPGTRGIDQAPVQPPPRRFPSGPR